MAAIAVLAMVPVAAFGAGQKPLFDYADHFVMLILGFWFWFVE